MATTIDEARGFDLRFPLGRVDEELKVGLDTKQLGIVGLSVSRIRYHQC